MSEGEGAAEEGVNRRGLDPPSRDRAEPEPRDREVQRVWQLPLQQQGPR